MNRSLLFSLVASLGVVHLAVSQNNNRPYPPQLNRNSGIPNVPRSDLYYEVAPGQEDSEGGSSSPSIGDPASLAAQGGAAVSYSGDPNAAPSPEVLRGLSKLKPNNVINFQTPNGGKGVMQIYTVDTLPNGTMRQVDTGGEITPAARRLISQTLVKLEQLQKKREQQEREQRLQSERMRRENATRQQQQRRQQQQPGSSAQTEQPPQGPAGGPLAFVSGYETMPTQVGQYPQNPQNAYGLPHQPPQQQPHQPNSFGSNYSPGEPGRVPQYGMYDNGPPYQGDGFRDPRFAPGYVGPQQQPGMSAYDAYGDAGYGPYPAYGDPYFGGFQPDPYYGRRDTAQGPINANRANPSQSPFGTGASQSSLGNRPMDPSQQGIPQSWYGPGPHYPFGGYPAPGYPGAAGMGSEGNNNPPASYMGPPQSVGDPSTGAGFPQRNPQSQFYGAVQDEGSPNRYVYASPHYPGGGFF